MTRLTRHLSAAALSLALTVICSPALAETVRVNDRIDVTSLGHGPDVILIPGLASSAHVWDAAASHLAADHRVHVVQVLGFAGTAPAANAGEGIIDGVTGAIQKYESQNHITSPAVVGHSLGGLIALRLAESHPEAAGRVMVVDSFPFLGALRDPSATPATVEPMARAMRDAIKGQGQAAYAAGEPAIMAGMIKTNGPDAKAAIAAASVSDHSVVAEAMYEDMQTDARPGLSGLSQPVTVLYPFDPTLGAPQSMIDGLYARAYAPVKQAHVLRIDDSRHFIMIDQPKRFEAELDAFLKP